MTGTTFQMHNDRNIMYPSITICPAYGDYVGGYDPNYVKSDGHCLQNMCPACPTGCDFGHLGRKVNLSNIINYLQYSKVNETG